MEKSNKRIDANCNDAKMKNGEVSINAYFRMSLQPIIGMMLIKLRFFTIFVRVN